MASNKDHVQLDLLGKEHLAELLKASSLLNSTLETRKVLESLMALANKLLRTEASSLILIDEKGERLFFKASAGARAKEIMRFNLDAEKGIVGWVIQNKKPYIAHDVESDSQWSQDVATQLDFPTHSILCVPVMNRGRLIGALEAINKADGERFDATDIILLTALADHAALAIENARLHSELSRDNETIIERIRLEHPIIGDSPAMKQLIGIIRKVTPTDSTVLIRGESGTGKELISRAIHYNSPRRGKPFTCVNCTLYSETLIESELFGHEQGAFTGASKRRIGRFEQADKGTIFLDEVGSISTDAQLKLLRVLENREFERLGGSDTVKVDVRVIAATNEDLESAIKEGRFREDLYYRLKVIEIYAPPLREIREDIPRLVAHLLGEQTKRIGRKIKKASPQAMELLTAYPWPGNVRELRNTIERAVVLGGGETLLPEHLPVEIRTYTPDKGDGTTLEDAERERIVQILEQSNWNKSMAAKLLGISRNRLDRKIKAYGIAQGE
jgi:Nif-specific regulatory protein